MKTIKFGKTGLEVPAIGLGCMRLTELEEWDIPKYIWHCISLGVNFFDHADIYGGGECERLFGESLKEIGIPRDQIILQSKCGIVPGWMYDLSYENIIRCVDNSLKRLGTEYLDILLLHRPDALVEPEEVAKAFDELETKGKVRYFGVSNHKPSQIELLKTAVKQDIQTNQIQFSIPFSNIISSGMEANMNTDGAVDRNGDVLNYCRLNNVTLQAWSPFQSGKGAFVDNNDGYPDLNWALGEISAKYNVTKSTIAAAWILRHPAKMQTIVGTMNYYRMLEISRAVDIELTREEWYRLYLSSGHIIP